jgi:hypothetical protein
VTTRAVERVHELPEYLDHWARVLPDTVPNLGDLAGLIRQAGTPDVETLRAGRTVYRHILDDAWDVLRDFDRGEGEEA